MIAKLRMIAGVAASSFLLVPDRGCPARVGGREALAPDAASGRPREASWVGRRRVDDCRRLAYAPSRRLGEVEGCADCPITASLS